MATQYMGEEEAFAVLSDVVCDGTDEALALNSLAAHMGQLRKDRGKLGDEVSRLRVARQALRDAICLVYENTDPASFHHARQPEHIAGWHRRLREILAEDLARH